MNNLLYSGGSSLVNLNIDQLRKSHSLEELQLGQKANPSIFSFLFNNQKDEQVKTVDEVCQAILSDLAHTKDPLSRESQEWKTRRPVVKEFVKHVTGLVGEPAKNSYLSCLQEYVKSPETLEARLALSKGIAPKPLNATSSGTYIFFNRQGKECGIFKPKEQEWGASGNPSWLIWCASMMGQNPQEIMGITTGESYRREKVAYKFAKEIGAGVAPTYITHFKHDAMDTSIFGSSSPPDLVGSFQVFIPKVKAVADVLNEQAKKGWPDKKLSQLKIKNVASQPPCRSLGDLIVRIVNMVLSLPYQLGVCLGFIPRPKPLFVDEIHRMGILDICMLNCDRHMGNLLIDDHHQLYPIDHGLTLPGKATRLRYDWKDFQQASVPFSAEERELIANLNVGKHIEILKKNNINDPAIHKRLIIATRLLQCSAKRGYTLKDIVDLMIGKQEQVGGNTLFEKYLVPAIRDDLSNLDQVIDGALKLEIFKSII